MVGDFSSSSTFAAGPAMGTPTAFPSATSSYNERTLETTVVVQSGAADVGSSGKSRADVGPSWYGTAYVGSS